MAKINNIRDFKRIQEIHQIQKQMMEKEQDVVEREFKNLIKYWNDLTLEEKKRPFRTYSDDKIYEYLIAMFKDRVDTRGYRTVAGKNKTLIKDNKINIIEYQKLVENDVGGILLEECYSTLAGITTNQGTPKKTVQLNIKPTVDNIKEEQYIFILTRSTAEEVIKEVAKRDLGNMSLSLNDHENKEEVDINAGDDDDIEEQQQKDRIMPIDTALKTPVIKFSTVIEQKEDMVKLYRQLLEEFSRSSTFDVGLATIAIAYIMDYMSFVGSSDVIYALDNHFAREQGVEDVWLLTIERKLTPFNIVIPTSYNNKIPLN